jgi:hypothetical protein
VDKRLEVLPGSLHGIALVADSPQARTLIRAFLTAH